MRTLILTVALLTPGVALAQYPTPHFGAGTTIDNGIYHGGTMSGNFTGGTYVGDGTSTTPGASNIINSPNITTPSITGGLLSGVSITGPGALTSSLLSVLFSQTHVIPDWYKQAGDGADDAPSIQRALAAVVPGGNMDFLAHGYNINSAIVETTPAVWRCVGSQVAKMPPNGGTWFNVTSTAFNPITISGAGAQGTRIEKCGFYQTQPAPAYPPAGSVGTWTPNAYPPFITINNVNGEVFITDPIWTGITKGVYSVGTARLDFEGWRNNFFDYGVEVHTSYDVNRFVNWQEWPFYADSKDVEKYTSANLQLIRLFRSDSPFIDKIFCITCEAALDFETETLASGSLGGPPTKVHIGDISVDNSQAAISNNAPGASFTADTIDFDGQDVTISSPTSLSGSAPLVVNAALNGADIGHIWAVGAAAGLINIANNTATGCSNTTASSAHIDNSAFANTTGYLLTALPCDGTSVYNTLQIATVPSITLSTSPGVYTVGAGGKLSWPTFVNQP